MNSSAVVVRYGTAEDASEIARLFMNVWQVSLKHLLPSGFLEIFDESKQKDKYAQRAVDPSYILLVAEIAGKIVGFVAATKNDFEQLDYAMQIKSMYVDPDYQRQGVGKKLFECVFGKLQEQGAPNVMLWCIKANAVASSFYEKHHGRRIEDIVSPIEYSAMPHVVYAWDSLYVSK